jgi:hypothetical protein
MLDDGEDTDDPDVDGLDESTDHMPINDDDADTDEDDDEEEEVVARLRRPPVRPDDTIHAEFATRCA